MLIYLFVFILGVAIARFAERGRNTQLGKGLPRKSTLGAILVAILLAGVSGLRWQVGTDYWNYVWLFPIYAEEATQGFSFLGEPGLRWIAWISMNINGDSATMFALAAIITIGLTVRTLWRWSPAFAFSVAIYILSGAWHGSFNGIRQYLACAILFAGHYYIIDRKLFKWLVIVLLATLFHVSAVVGILLYFVPTKRTSLRIQFIVLSLGIVGMLTFGSILELISVMTGVSDVRDGVYANRNINPLRLAFAFVPIALYWLLRNRKAIQESNSWFHVNMLAVYAASFLASASSAYMARFAIYPLPFIAIALAAVTSVSDARERAIFRTITIFLFAIFMYFEISSTNNLRNFQWIFERT